MALMTRACAYSGIDTSTALTALSELEALAATTGLTLNLHATRSVLAGSLGDDDTDRMRLGLQGMRTASAASSNHWFAISCLAVAKATVRLGNRRAAAVLTGGLRRFAASPLAGLDANSGLREFDLADEHEAFVAGSRLSMAELVAVAEEATQALPR